MLGHYFGVKFFNLDNLGDFQKKVNILGCVIFCVDNVGGHHYFCGSY